MNQIIIKVLVKIKYYKFTFNEKVTRSYPQ